MKKLSFILIAIIFTTFQLKAYDYSFGLDEGPYGSILLNSDSYGYGMAGDRYSWGGFVGDTEYQLTIRYSTDFPEGDYHELRIYVTYQSYQRELLLETRSSESDVIITSEPVRYIDIEFDRLQEHPTNFQEYEGLTITYEPYEPGAVEPGIQNFDVVKANKLSINTGYTVKGLNIIGDGIINGKILITRDPWDFNVYANNVSFPYDFNVNGTSYLENVSSRTSSVLGNLTIGTSSSTLAPLYVYTATGTGNSKITAILGNASDHWTHFGGRYGGRIKGGIYGSLTLEGNSNAPATGDRNIYLNPTLNSNIIMAQGGGKVGIGAAPVKALLEIYNITNPNINIRNEFGRMEFGLASNAGAFATGAIPGDGIIRTLGDSHNTILFLPNDNNDGNHYIGIGDMANGIWAKFFNNKTFRMDGTLYAKEVKIRTDVWSDFVFHKDYRLPSLNEVNLFILENGHLPEIPSEAEVMENGITLSEMQAKLLQKIEELTLYAIEQQKRIEELEKIVKVNP